MSLFNKNNKNSLMPVKNSYKETGKYSNLTYEKISEVIKDLMFTKDVSLPKTKKEITFRELPEGFDLDFQIQDSYLYTVSGDLCLWTGSGGIRDMIKAARESNVSDFFIAQSIFIQYGTKEYWIGDVKWKKK